MHAASEQMESDMGEADPAFKKAREEYSEIGYSPTLTKEQLKMTILLRRVSEGKDEPEIEKTRDIKHPVRTCIKFILKITCRINFSYCTVKIV